MPFIESMREYIERQGCEHIRVTERDLEAMKPEEVRAIGLQEGSVLFANGARCVVDGFDRLSTALNPPGEHFALLRAKRIFLVVKLNREISKWNHFRGECAELILNIRKYGPHTPPPPADAAERLARGKQRIEALRAQVAQLDVELEKSPEAELRRRHEEAARLESKKLNEKFQEIEAIKI
jgi:hypothetical protein